MKYWLFGRLAPLTRTARRNPAEYFGRLAEERVKRDCYFSSRSARSSPVGSTEASELMKMSIGFEEERVKVKGTDFELERVK